MIYALGDRAEQLCKQLKVESCEKYDDVIRILDGHFLPKKNIIFERYKFNLREQKGNEDIKEFIQELYKLSEGCEYGKLREELIRDRLIVGMRDKKTSERLLLSPNLSLEDASRLA